MVLQPLVFLLNKTNLFTFVHIVLYERALPPILTITEQEMLTLPEHLISPLVFIQIHVVLSFVSPYFK